MPCQKQAPPCGAVFICTWEPCPHRGEDRTWGAAPDLSSSPRRVLSFVTYQRESERSVDKLAKAQLGKNISQGSLALQ